jgi:trimethylamine--corrinoid protein Co-methyltransferase
VNFIHLAFGMLDQLLTASYEQAVIDNEILAAAFRLAEGIQVTPESIGLEQLKAAGPGGQFLDQAYTLANLRRAQWQPRHAAARQRPGAPDPGRTPSPAAGRGAGS